MAPKRDASEQSSQKGGRYNSDKYIHVHHYDTGRWGAWVREPKVGGVRLFLGTHNTERLAARCQDRALLKLEMDPSMTQPIKLNFYREDYNEDELMRNTLTTADFFKYLTGESRGKYKQYRPTSCLIKFLAEERALGNRPDEEGVLAICARKPASKGSTSKLPKSTNKKQIKKPIYEETYPDSDEEPDHYPSESEEEEEDLSPEGVTDEDMHLAMVPYVPAPEPLAPVAPVPSSLTATEKRSRILKYVKPLASVAPTPLPDQVPRHGTRKRSRTVRFAEPLVMVVPVAPSVTEIGKGRRTPGDKVLSTEDEAEEEEALLQALLILTAGPQKKKSRHLLLGEAAN